MKIGVIGLGKIGLPMACLYAKNHEVIGIDGNPKIVDCVNAKKNPHYEPGLDSLLSQANIKASMNYADLIGCQFIFVMLPSPSESSGRFSSQYVIKACQQLNQVMGDYPYNVVICSTLMPGEMDLSIVPLFSENALVYYSPVFVAIGNVIKGLSQADFYVIGARDNAYALSNLYKVIFNAKNVRVMSYVNAELVKLLLNCFITMKISLANTCAEICEALSGANSDIVMECIGLDSRIGQKCMKAGLGYGGTCFPRDSKALVRLEKDLHVSPLVEMAVDKFNEKHDWGVARKAIEMLGLYLEKHVITILGITYKTDVDLVDESNALKIAQELGNLGNTIKIYDPQGMARAQLKYPAAEYCGSIADALKGSELVIVAVPWHEFKNLSPSVFKENMKTASVLDCWHIYDGREFKKAGITYHAIGISDV